MNIYINMHYTNVLPRTGGMVIWRREECGMCLYITSFKDTCYVKKQNVKCLQVYLHLHVNCSLNQLKEMIHI